ncbi:MAG: transposon-transfer assisting family protein [Lachnospiraceae bacterium]|nr:transposon-transfer assisting family protein [Lachnospiraceae bacterium]
MNNKFTVEEVNLICVFEFRSRTKVIGGIKKAIKHLDDDEMVELSNRVVAKLDDMTDKEFAEMEFVVTE